MLNDDDDYRPEYIIVIAGITVIVYTLILVAVVAFGGFGT
jgi:hypothetical protein